MTSASGLLFGIVLPDDSLGVLYTPGVGEAVISEPNTQRSEASASADFSAEGMEWRTHDSD